jgi:hypothetical protein
MSDVFTTLATADGFGVFGFDPATQWGLFLDGVSVIEADSVTAFSFKQDYPLSTYKVEQGGFETYDKVETPYDVRMQFVAGLDADNRRAFIDSVMAIKGDLNRYDAVTPDQTYIGCNVAHVDYEQHADRGVGLVRINVYLTQIRVTDSAQYNTAAPLNNTKSPESADPVNNGTVQSKSITITPVVH